MEPGARSGIDFLGANAVATETRQKYGLGPCGQSILDAVTLGHSSPAKLGPNPNMLEDAFIL